MATQLVTSSMGMMVFKVAYTHMAILLSILESLVLEKQFALPQKFITQLLRDAPSSTRDATAYILPSLFCVCLIFGPESQPGPAGMYDPLSPRIPLSH